MDIDDEQRFREFVGARSKALLQTAYLLTGDWEHGRDLVQSALAGVARRWSQLADPSQAEAYARKAIYHAHVDRTRLMSWRRERTTASPPDTAAARSDPADLVASRRDLIAALRQLPRGQRAVVVLRYFEDRTDEDIAEVLGISTGTVRSQHHKALKALRVSASIAVDDGEQDIAKDLKKDTALNTVKEEAAW
ncbi:RNA polymerase, sigma-24 subunit, ECF subfamily [Catenulispora acidiphila DSM 44928]|uniref:RNA polymerase, sigma-24 subunit, ECF subfamily n=1 Tax=Catenulispora acidiphila (strain DSM 44928 / JCM 14897 / NBRC 102108 / NRRL B-24433 / ID139908) TaxID=479433 RepID=C7Q8T4_CATAD|nr:SigE family RNA polymerase sigma factor [Catenulispora acidiphila]ACU70349.1 RNA polymerase, sigma-24 subunit, ECF subfamily [Catenulispora acidiphila DSM 44928]